MDNKKQETYVNSEMRVVPDLTHHLSDLANARKPSPLKDLMPLVGRPGEFLTYDLSKQKY
jgi:hypothetical protein